MSKTDSNNEFTISEDETIKFKTEEVDQLEELDFRNVVKRPKKYGRSFKLSWEYDKRFSSWLIRSPNNLPFCTCCGIELKATGGTQDLKYHMKTRKHKKNGEQISCQETEESKTKGPLQIAQVDQIVKNIELDNYKVQYPLENEKDIKNNLSYQKDTFFTEIDKKLCKMCGEIVYSSNLNCSYNFDQTHVIVSNSFNIEEEKRIIELEMRQVKNEFIDTKTTRTPVQAFCDLLVSDMSKLPDNVQRKIRMNVMQRVDDELSKVEKN